MVLTTDMADLIENIKVYVQRQPETLITYSDMTVSVEEAKSLVGSIAELARQVHQMPMLVDYKHDAIRRVHAFHVYPSELAQAIAARMRSAGGRGLAIESVIVSLPAEPEPLPRPIKFGAKRYINVGREEPDEPDKSQKRP